MKRYMFLALAIATAITETGCQSKSTATESKKESIVSDSLLKLISLDTVKMMPVGNELKLSGKVGYDENRVVKVFPNSSGQVIQVLVSFGDHVQKGQTLALIKSADVAGNYSDLNAAEADLRITRRQMDNARSLYEGGISSQREFEEAKENYEKSLAAVNKIRSVISINGGGHTNAGGTYMVTAPASGFIVEKKIAPGAFIRGDMNDNLFTISDLRDVWVWANVYETDIAKVKQGYATDISILAYPGKIFRGRVDQMNGLIDPENKSLRLRITLPNDSLLLKPEMFADILVHNQEAASELAIPTSAVVTDNGKTFAVVYRNNDDVKVKPITVKKVNGAYSFIEGLAPGEEVIAQNQLLLYNSLAGK